MFWILFEVVLLSGHRDLGMVWKGSMNQPAFIMKVYEKLLSTTQTGRPLFTFHSNHDRKSHSEDSGRVERNTTLS
jgi:UDP-2,3-diacylglucosamine pyrophosphatase LpxH